MKLRQPCTLLTIRAISYLSLMLIGTANATDNPYNLIPDRHIAGIYKEDIQSHWDNNGIRGDFTGEKDINIAYMTFITNQAKAAVVISSGRTESFIKYKEVVYDLNRNGYSVFIHDHRGQGLSGRMTDDPQLGYVEEFDYYVDDLHTFVSNVVSDHSFDTHFLLAHSMGGAIASIYLQRDNHIFDAAVLSSPMHEPDTGMIPTGLACTIISVKDWIGKEKEYAPKKGPYNEDEVFAEENCCTHSKNRFDIARSEFDTIESGAAKLGGPSVGWVLQACEGSSKARESAEKIKVPVLLLNSGADKVVTRSGQKEFCDVLNKSSSGLCKWVEVPSAYHELFIESDAFRDQAMTEVFQFFENQIED